MDLATFLQTPIMAETGPLESGGQDNGLLDNELGSDSHEFASLFASLSDPPPTLINQGLPPQARTELEGDAARAGNLAVRDGKALPPVTVFSLPPGPVATPTGTEAAVQVTAAPPGGATEFQAGVQTAWLQEALLPAKDGSRQPIRPMAISKGSDILSGSGVETPAVGRPLSVADLTNASIREQTLSESDNDSLAQTSDNTSRSLPLETLRFTSLSVGLAAVATPLDRGIMDSTAITYAKSDIQIPFQQPGWDNALSERLQWLVSQRFTGAELKLNPAELGPLEVRIKLDQDAANITFVSQHAVVREALDAALPRLRELMEQGGITLADVSVEQQRSGNQDAQTDKHPHDPSGLADEGVHAEPGQQQTHGMLVSISPEGLLDAYA
ncbi:MAG: hypothetical protein BMS9Abin36_0550 [Gammaproteobacteria bacterium]|nr:MAG: hypothetical protein BMS9Abin36_0550 [Gammaproteobacteria bacterium]